MKKVKTLIIGAGVTGLSLAFYLKKANTDFILIEKSNSPGGALNTIHKDGWILESGPNTILLTNTFFTEIVQEVGLEQRLLKANPAAKKRFIIKNKQPVKLPSSPLAFFNSRLFGVKTKLGLLKEPFVSKSALEDEDLASFVIRRLGKEFLDYAINPFVAGVYAGKPELLSVRYGFPKLYQIEQKHGSLILGALKGPGKDRDPNDIPRTKAPMVTFEGGNSEFANTVMSFLGDEHAKLNSGIQTVTKVSDGYEIVLENGDTIHCQNLVLTTPVGALGKIKWNGLAGDALPKELMEITYPPVSVVHLGYKREQVNHPLDGFGTLVPEVEQMNILGVLFNSSLFPNRTPDPDKVLLTVFTGGMRNPEITEKSNADLIQVAHQDVSKLLGINGEPILSHVTKWPAAIPQYQTGYGTVYQSIERFEGANKGLHLLGNYRNGISVGDCVKNAALFAQHFL